jgi:hypothetical protein
MFKNTIPVSIKTQNWSGNSQMYILLMLELEDFVQMPFSGSIFVILRKNSKVGGIFFKCSNQFYK